MYTFDVTLVLAWIHGDYAMLTGDSVLTIPNARAGKERTSFAQSQQQGQDVVDEFTTKLWMLTPTVLVGYAGSVHHVALFVDDVKSLMTFGDSLDRAVSTAAHIHRGAEPKFQLVFADVDTGSPRLTVVDSDSGTPVSTTSAHDEVLLGSLPVGPICVHVSVGRELNPHRRIVSTRHSQS